MIETLNKVMQVQKQLLQELGHEPTPEEVAEEMNLPVERVQQIMKMAQQPISLQSPVGDSDDTNFGDFIEDKAAENPYDMTAYSLLREKIMDVLDSLTERERRVLSLRFGLQDGYSRTLEEVGRQFKVTRERIRQIEAKALRKMRHPTRIRQLHGFFEGEFSTTGPEASEGSSASPTNHARPTQACARAGFHLNGADHATLPIPYPARAAGCHRARGAARIPRRRMTSPRTADCTASLCRRPKPRPSARRSWHFPRRPLPRLI